MRSLKECVQVAGALSAAARGGRLETRRRRGPPSTASVAYVLVVYTVRREKPEEDMVEGSSSARLGQWAHTFLILGMMLGGGTFGIVRELSRLVGSQLWLPFALAGVVVTLTSESMAYLISEHPGAGSHTRFVVAATGSRRLGPQHARTFPSPTHLPIRTETSLLSLSLSLSLSRVGPGFVVGCLPLIDAISAFAVCALLCGNYLVELVGEPGSAEQVPH